MKEIKYQIKYIGQLTDKIVTLLDNNEVRQKIVFKSPTGSGKTYMTAMALSEALDTCRNDSRHRYEDIAFVWLAPNKLHSQAFESLSRLFQETRALRPILFDSIEDGKLQSGDVLCLNWGSIHSADNVFVRETEQGKSLWTIMEDTRRAGFAIVAVIDEEHLHWDKTADRAAYVLDQIKPVVEVRVSATPKTLSPHTVTVTRKEVVEAQMIKERVVINPEIEVNEEMEVEDYLLHEALKKRDLLAECYSEMGKKINPLLLIQLPNDNATISTEDKTMKEEIATRLKETYDITVENGRLAIWLSDKIDKQNLEDIEKPDSLVKVLLFKEAIAKGWDCPRASVLLIFRKLQSNEFAIQTLGRILRMPEQKYYFNPLLNIGYVYTNLSQDRITVAGESEDYWKQNLLTSYRRKNLHNILLPSVYELYSASVRNRLGSDFNHFLYEYMKKHWLGNATNQTLFDIDEEGNMVMSDTLPEFGDTGIANRTHVEKTQKIRFNVRGVTITIPRDVKLDKVEETELRIEDTREYTRTSEKIENLFLEYCRTLLTKYEKACTPMLAGAITDVMETLFELNEWDARKVVLSVKPMNNNAKFTDLLTRALDEYYLKVTERKKKAKERSFKSWQWEVPEKREYNADHNEERPDVDNHALMPYVQRNQNLVQERNFVTFLESYEDYIDWWYKNGDEGRSNYAIEYLDPAQGKRLFYVDFIIRMKNGDIYLFDTKGSDLGGDLEHVDTLVAKHNALHDYVKNSRNPHLKVGSLIKYVGNAWRYCPLTISNMETTGWSSFHPDQLI